MNHGYNGAGVVFLYKKQDKAMGKWLPLEFPCAAEWLRFVFSVQYINDLALLLFTFFALLSSLAY